MAKTSRPDDRKLDELRPITMKVGVVNRADGSAEVQFGKTKVIAAVYGPREIHPRHQENPQRSVLRCRYNMLPFSVSDRKRPGPDKRSIELGKVITEALEPAIILEEFPKTAIDVDLEVIQADAGTRTTAINAASLALADAGIPMRDLVTSIAAGRANGNIILDVTKEEEDASDAIDMPVAMMPRTKKITLMQMDGIASEKELAKILEVAEKGCLEIYEKQKKALLEKYESHKEE